MANLTISEKQARNIYPTAVPELKAILEESFPKGFFSQSIMERVVDAVTACTELGRNPNTRFDMCGDKYEEAEEDIKLVAEALREGKNPKYCKWSPYFYWDGSGFRLSVAGCDSSTSGVGARLRVDSREKALHLGKIMEPQYNIYLTGE